MAFQIPDSVCSVLLCLRNAGYRAVPVGGCVRDLLRGVVPHDWDVTTSATPDEVQSVFATCSGLKTLPTGKKYGTVTVLADNTAVEVTTFRADSVYTDGRRPDSVCFSRNLEEDLARRDFTINAMCLGEEGEIIDLFGGQKDLRDGVIRAIGNPYQRVTEDALRILRALRFAATLDFTIAPQTADSLLRHTDWLTHLSAERVSAEFLRLICAPAAERVLLEFRKIIFAIIPELEFKGSHCDACEYLGTGAFVCGVRALTFAPPEPALRMGLLLKAVGSQEAALQGASTAKEILLRLRLPKKLCEDVVFLVMHQDMPLYSADRKTIKQCLLDFGETRLTRLLALQTSDAHTLPNALLQERLVLLEQTGNLIQQVLDEVPVLSLSQLAVTGSDLIAVGVTQGPQLGEMLWMLLGKVLFEELPNEKAALLGAVKAYMTDTCAGAKRTGSNTQNNHAQSQPGLF